MITPDEKPRGSIEKRKSRSMDDVETTTLAIGSEYEDQALQLVGKKRVTQFSEEEYAKLRRKLVCFQ